MENILQWLQEWYSSNCDGDWEHECEVKIGTLDNPGWSIDIDLSYTPIEFLEMDSGLVEVNDTDWYIYQVKNKMFTARGDQGKLIFLLSKFREIVEANPN